MQSCARTNVEHNKAVVMRRIHYTVQLFIRAISKIDVYIIHRLRWRLEAVIVSILTFTEGLLVLAINPLLCQAGMV